MSKTYLVQMKETIVMESTIEAKSKAEALFLIKEGQGDFDSRTATNLPPTFKVLKEHTSAEEEEFWNQRTRDTWNRG